MPDDTQPLEVDPVELAEANLAVVKLERRLVELKDSDPDSDELRQVKTDLRSAREVFRSLKEPEKAAAEREARELSRALRRLAEDPDVGKAALAAGEKAKAKIAASETAIPKPTVGGED